MQTSLKRHLVNSRSRRKSFGGIKEHLTRSNLYRSTIHLEIFFIFFDFDRFDIFRMRKADIHVVFEKIKNKNPVLFCGLHTNAITIILDEPFVKTLNIRVDGRKRFLLIFGFPSWLVIMMVVTIAFWWTSSPQQMEYFNFIITITTLIKKE